MKPSEINETKTGSPAASDLIHDIPTINRKLFRLILPIVIEGALPTFASVIVTGMIGRIDVLSISAMGIVFIIYSILWALFRGLAVGEMVYVSRYYAQKNFEKVGQVVQQSLLSSIAVVLVLCALVFFGAEIILQVFNPSAPLLQLSAHYLRIMLFGIPFFAMLLLLGGFYQGIGKTGTSMAVILFMHIANVILCYTFIFGHFGSPAMGFLGAAYASAGSQIIAFVISVCILIRNKELAHHVFSLRAIRSGWNHIADIYRVGLPASFESILWQFAIMIVTRMLLLHGESAFAAYQIGNTAESISYMPATGFVIAATTLISQAAGANDGKLARIYLKQILKGVIGITIVAAAVFIFAPQTLILLLTDKKDVIPMACTYLMIMGMIEIPLNITAVLGGALRALGHPRVPFVVSLIGLWVVRVPLVLLATFAFHLPVISFWIIIAIDVLCRFSLTLYYFMKKSVMASI